MERDVLSRRAVMVLFIIFIIAFPLCAQSMEKTVLPSAPGIHVTGKPGSRVYINGQYRGNVPCYIMLADGVTKIKVRLGYEEEEWDVRRDDSLKGVTNIGEATAAAPAVPTPAPEPEPIIVPEPVKLEPEPEPAPKAEEPPVVSEEGEEQEAPVEESAPEQAVQSGPGSLEIREFIQGSLMMIDGKRISYNDTPLLLESGEKDVYIWKKGKNPLREVVLIRPGEKAELTQSHRLGHGRKSLLWFLAGASLAGSSYALNEYYDAEYARYAGIGAAVCLLPMFTELFLHGNDQTEYQDLTSSGRS